MEHVSQARKRSAWDTYMPAVVSFAIDSMGTEVDTRSSGAKAAGTRDGDERKHKRDRVMWSKYAPIATAPVVRLISYEEGIDA